MKKIEKNIIKISELLADSPLVAFDFDCAYDCGAVEVTHWLIVNEKRLRVILDELWNNKM